MFAVLHFFVSTPGFLFLDLALPFLHFHTLRFVSGKALLADIEIAFFAVVELVSLLPAEMALAFGLKCGEFEWMLIIASFQRNGPTLKAIIDAIFTAVHAS